MSSFSYGAYMYCYFICVTIYLIACPYWCECGPGCGFMLNILGAAFSIPLVYPYLNDQIIGPDYRIIQCDQIDSLGSWQDQWCANHQRLGYRISKLWFIYQYQSQKEKSRQQIESATAKNVKSDMVNKEINIVEVVTIG
ncbi:hypothetical protein C2G38_2169818 [Gigaspora rosea]|uniref:Uncharacterized protein n=1 Tax=Gigaspora rosea TaxID=44941 RepID=A0A397VQE0_9GLOM|nr:hypothetical protein C2G38_2169818 [Gigaspora rosea]